jgi:hypothetical protein
MDQSTNCWSLVQQFGLLLYIEVDLGTLFVLTRLTPSSRHTFLPRSLFLPEKAVVGLHSAF